MDNINQIKLSNNIEFFARQVVEGFITGKHKSPYHGFSVEFAEHRLYNSGESTRHIDWKLFDSSWNTSSIVLNSYRVILIYKNIYIRTVAC